MAWQWTHVAAIYVSPPPPTLAVAIAPIAGLAYSTPADPPMVQAALVSMGTVAPITTMGAGAIAAAVAGAGAGQAAFEDTFDAICAPRLLVRRPRRAARGLGLPSQPGVMWAKHYATGRGKYRVFNDAEYRFYRDNSAPPEEGDSPFATNSTLPHTPADVYADGTWYLSVSYFNGVIDSGFLPIGPNGETYLRLDIAAGEETLSPPNAPLSWHLELHAGGVVRVVGVAYQVGTLRPTEWAIGFELGMGSPIPGSPDYMVTMPTRGIAILEYDLPAQSHDVKVNVLVQTRRNDGDWVYSASGSTQHIYADAEGPTVPLSAERYAGSLPEDL